MTEFWADHTTPCHDCRGSKSIRVERSPAPQLCQRHPNDSPNEIKAHDVLEQEALARGGADRQKVLEYQRRFDPV